jgi:hypothetical protein
MANQKEKQRVFKWLIQQLLKQTASGLPIEAQGFVDHPVDGEGMPTIEHRHGRERPDFVEADNMGWESLQ